MRYGDSVSLSRIRFPCPATVGWVLASRLEVELLHKFAQKKLPFTVKTWLGDFLSVGWPSLPYEMATSRLYWTFSTDIKKLFSIWRPPPLKLLRPPAKLPENDKAGYHFNLFHNRHLLGLGKVGFRCIIFVVPEAREKLQWGAPSTTLTYRQINKGNRVQRLTCRRGRVCSRQSRPLSLLSFSFGLWNFDRALKPDIGSADVAVHVLNCPLWPRPG